MSDPFIAHSEISNEIYIICGKKKYPVTEQVISAMKATGRLNERPHGYWINMKADDLRINDYQCSNCGNWADEGKEYFPFCWRCGADMRGGRE